MSLIGAFSVETPAPESVAAPRKRRKRDAPFAIRLNKTERARLVDEAKGLPLGTYIKAKVLGAPPLRLRGSRLALADRRSLAQALALLGQSRVANNLNQLAHAANIGALPFTPETEAELRDALEGVRAIRRLLMTGLGLKPEDTP